MGVERYWKTMTERVVVSKRRRGTKNKCNGSFSYTEVGSCWTGEEMFVRNIVDKRSERFQCIAGFYWVWKLLDRARSWGRLVLLLVRGVISTIGSSTQVAGLRMCRMDYRLYTIFWEDECRKRGAPPEGVVWDGIFWRHWRSVNVVYLNFGIGTSTCRMSRILQRLYRNRIYKICGEDRLYIHESWLQNL